MFKKIEKAVVKIIGKGGHGVLVGDEYIITAAHCVTWKSDGSMAIGDDFLEEIELDGKLLKVSPVIVEPVTDIAVLGPVDAGAFTDEYEEFCDVCQTIEPMKICIKDFQQSEELKAHVYTHDKGWVTATAQQLQLKTPNLYLKYDTGIKGGSSGGPVVSEEGELLGILSRVYGKDQGLMPRPYLALPAWILNNILD